MIADASVCVGILVPLLAPPTTTHPIPILLSHAIARYFPRYGGSVWRGVCTT